MAIVTGSNVCEITSVPGEVIQKSLDGYAPPLGRPVPYIRDLSRAERDFGFSATPVEEWMQTTVDRYREHYMGHDSQGHSARNQEELVPGQASSSRSLKLKPAGDIGALTET